jgi:hypothetical protein
MNVVPNYPAFHAQVIAEACEEKAALAMVYPSSGKRWARKR